MAIPDNQRLFSLKITGIAGGLREDLTSYDNATVGSGTIVNDVQFAYNDFSQLTADYQAHGSAVNTSTTQKSQYSYAGGADNTF